MSDGWDTEYNIPMRTLSSLARFLLVLLSSTLFALSFPSFLEKTLHPPTAFLAWGALVPFFIALEGVSLRKAAGLGFLWGFLSCGAVQYWVLFLAEAQYLAAPAWAALNLVLALHYLLWAVVYVALRRRFPRSSPLLAPVLWTAVEYLRTVPPVVGYPSALVGTTQAGYPALLSIASFAGVWGLTFLIVWVNAALFDFLLQGGRPRLISRRGQAALATPIAVTLLALFLGVMSTGTGALREAGIVALVQPSINQSAKWDRSQEKATYDLLEKLTREAGAARPSLILWPETAAPAYLSMNWVAMERVRHIVRVGAAPLLAGCLDSAKEKVGKVSLYNAAVHFSSEGIDEKPYRKRHLVPFGEYVPAQSFFFFLGPIVSELGSFDAGERYRSFQARGFTYSPLICFETEYPHETRRAAKDADAIVNISNDAWYGATAAAYQHALIAVMRAAENGKPLLRCANTGISLVTDPFGRIIASTPMFKETMLTAPVLIGNGVPTFYARFGDWLAVLCSALSILAIAVALIVRLPQKEFTKQA